MLDPGIRSKEIATLHVGALNSTHRKGRPRKVCVKSTGLNETPWQVGSTYDGI